ncbi:MAG: hypothetical protein AAF587_44565 [Bacteroidota bacterium]
MTATNAAGLRGQTPLGALTGETPDISQYLDFGWYDWVWFKENAGLDVPRLGRFLGISESATIMTTYWILPESGIPVSAGTVQRVTHLEQQTDSFKEKCSAYTKKIADTFKEDRLSKDAKMPSISDWEDLLEEDDDFAAEFNQAFDNPDVPKEDDLFDPDTYDNYLNMELTVDRGGEYPEFARVTKHLKDHQGNPIGKSHDNFLMDTSMYEVEFADGHKQAMAANFIAQNMFASVDEEER